MRRPSARVMSWAGILVLTCSLLLRVSFAQVGGSLDPVSFVEFSLKTIASFKSSERRNARGVIAQQISLLLPDQQANVTSALLSKSQTADINGKIDILGTLAAYPASWATKNTDADARLLYERYLSEKDETLKSAYDSTLANAKGLYRDGIRDFNRALLDSLKSAEAKFRSMATKYPESRFSENASFYTGLAITNQFVLGDARNTLLQASNVALEDYIKKVEAKQFGKKADFYAAGYFYRGLNEWIQKDIKEARKWMDAGSKKFSDDDSIYVYQLIVSPGNKAVVIDRYLPARSTFGAVSQTLGKMPPPQYPDVDILIKSIASL